MTEIEQKIREVTLYTLNTSTTTNYRNLDELKGFWEIQQHFTTTDHGYFETCVEVIKGPNKGSIGRIRNLLIPAILHEKMEYNRYYGKSIPTSDGYTFLMDSSKFRLVVEFGETRGETVSKISRKLTMNFNQVELCEKQKTYIIDNKQRQEIQAVDLLSQTLSVGDLVFHRECFYQIVRLPSEKTAEVSSLFERCVRKVPTSQLLNVNNLNESIMLRKLASS